MLAAITPKKLRQLRCSLTPNKESKRMAHTTETFDTNTYEEFVETFIALRAAGYEPFTTYNHGAMALFEDRELSIVLRKYDPRTKSNGDTATVVLK
jgi:hypothetical protein